VLVEAGLQALDERERRIVELRFGFDGEVQSLEAIGRELGITRERVRQLESDAFARLERELESLVRADADELADAA
jgi:RNA polymerase sigma factor (sigma-70 family)